MEETDAQLLALYREGDVEALERLVLKYRRPLFGFILGMLLRQGDAEDEESNCACSRAEG